MNKFDLVFEQVMKSLDGDVKPSDKNRYAYKSVKLIIEDINSPINIDGATRKFSFEEAAGLSEAQLISEGIGDSFVEAVKSKMSAIAEALRTAKRKSESECLSILNAAKDSFIIKWLDGKYGISNKIKSAISTKIENGVTIMDVHAIVVDGRTVVLDKNIVIKPSDEETAPPAEESVTEPNSNLIEEGIAEAMANLKNRLKDLWAAVLKICITVLLILMAYMSISDSKAGMIDPKYEAEKPFNKNNFVEIGDLQKEFGKTHPGSLNQHTFDDNDSNESDSLVPIDDANPKPDEKDLRAKRDNLHPFGKSEAVIRIFDERDNLIDSIEIEQRYTAEPDIAYTYKHMLKEIISTWGGSAVKIVGNINYSKFESGTGKLSKRVFGKTEHVINKDLSAKHKSDYAVRGTEYVILGDEPEYYSNGKPFLRNGKPSYKNSQELNRTEENDSYWDDLVYLLSLNTKDDEFAKMSIKDKIAFLKSTPSLRGLAALNKLIESNQTNLLDKKLMEHHRENAETHEDWTKTYDEIRREDDERREREEIRRLVRQGH